MTGGSICGVPTADLRRLAGAIEVVKLSADRDAAVERFVEGHAQALLYHSLRFRDFLVDLLGCQPLYGVAIASDEVVGVMPVMSAAGPYGRVLNSLPFFGSNGGILAKSPTACAALATWYDGQAASDGVAASTVVGNPLDPDGISFVHDFVDARVGCMTPLAGDGDPGARLLSLIDGSARRNVAKADRCGVTVEVDNDAFGVLADFHRAGMEAIGGRVKTPAFFEAVPRCFRAGVDYDLYVARLGDEVVATLLVFFYGAVAEYYMPATAPESRSEQPMAAVLQRAMVDAMDRGFAWWNWGGSWVTQENLIRFKTKWGGQPREYRYWTQVNDDNLLSAQSHALLEGYPGFFVAPFSSLRPGQESAG